MIEYCQYKFLFIQTSFKKQIVIFSENGLQIKFPRLREREKALILIIYNKNIFNANNEKRKIWKKKGKLSLQLKRKRKRIIISKFLTSVKKLRVFDFMFDH